MEKIVNVKYKANDGELFDSALECEKYESMQVVRSKVDILLNPCIKTGRPDAIIRGILSDPEPFCEILIPLLSRNFFEKYKPIKKNVNPPRKFDKPAVERFLEVAKRLSEPVSASFIAKTAAISNDQVKNFLNLHKDAFEISEGQNCGKSILKYMRKNV